ncbi:hypothetical protein GCM10009802_55630 [Streptomyces synnematoformans]|uniref:Uncharacterized protein n=1 Tax=Streptomyces synnematoformans TaxID=415721 RepID=A0ABN1ZK69_9ACTN
MGAAVADALALAAPALTPSLPLVRLLLRRGSRAAVLSVTVSPDVSPAPGIAGGLRVLRGSGGRLTRFPYVHGVGARAGDRV